ncbi:DUF6777 domain-containing protein [Streptomyces sporangiiformans]|uniref:DUF6777 domain-containing protein n=1 Tax=Streptomyces sporangiiformans TaxID=2315329 RepID=UPI003B8A8B7A
MGTGKGARGQQVWKRTRAVRRYQEDIPRRPCRPADVLRVGTALLLDRYAVLWVRCSSGDPPPSLTAVTDEPVDAGERRPGFEPGTAILPSRRPLGVLMLTHVTADDRFARPVGGTGPADGDMAAASAGGAHRDSGPGEQLRASGRPGDGGSPNQARIHDDARTIDEPDHGRAPEQEVDQ